MSTTLRRLAALAVILPTLWVVGCSSSPTEEGADSEETASSDTTLPETAASTDEVPTAEVPSTAPESTDALATTTAPSDETTTLAQADPNLSAPAPEAAPAEVPSAWAPSEAKDTAAAAQVATEPKPKRKIRRSKPKAAAPVDSAPAGMPPVDAAQFAPPPPPVTPPPPPVAEAAPPPPPPAPVAESVPPPAAAQPPADQNFGDTSAQGEVMTVEPWYMNKMILGGIAFVLLAGALVYMRVSRNRE